MKILDGNDPGVLEMRSDVLGCVVVAGFVFFAAGGAAVAFGLGRIPVDIIIDPELKIAALAAGAIGLLLGLVCMGGRSGRIFDRRQQTMTEWSGWFVPMRRRTTRLDGYSRVDLTKEVSRSQKSSTTYFPVRLTGHADQPINIDREMEYLDSRRLAEAVAKTLHWPMCDSSSGEEVVREADRLDESLRDRLRRLGERVELAPRPHTTRAEIMVTSSEVKAEIPGLAAKSRMILNLVVAGLGLGFALFFFGAPMILHERSMDSVFNLLPMLFVLVPLGIVLAKLNGFNRPVSVHADRSRLRIKEGRRLTEIPGEELEELSLAGLDIGDLFEARSDGSLVVDPKHLDTPQGASYGARHGQPPSVPPAIAGIVQTLAGMAPNSRAILARSDRSSVSFGRTLESEELTYLYSALVKVMSD